MATRNSSSSKKLWSLVTTIYRDRVLSYRGNNNNLLSSKFVYGCAMNPGLRLFSSNAGSFHKFDLNKVKDEINEKIQPQVPSTPKYNLLSRLKWLMSSILLLLIPLWKRSKTLPELEGEVVMIVEEVEEMVDVVEHIATITEKTSAMVASSLPDKCKLKQIALKVEHVSNVLIEDAEETKKIINMVDDLKRDFTALRNRGDSRANWYKILKIEDEKT